jgi:hypothetical protein
MFRSVLAVETQLGAGSFNIDDFKQLWSYQVLSMCFVLLGTASN